MGHQQGSTELFGKGIQMGAAIGGIRMQAPGSAYSLGRCGMVAGLLQASVLTGMLLISAGAHGQAASSYDDLVSEGLSEFAVGNWVEAYNLFKKAHEVAPSARTLRGMGMTSYELKHYPRAIEQLRAALASTDRALRPDSRAHVQDLIERSERLVGTLNITVTPAGAVVLVNKVQTDARTVVVPVGEATIRAELAGHDALERIVRVDGGEQYTVELDFHRMAKPAPVRDSGSEMEQVDLGLSSESRDDDSIASSPWLWTGIGVAVVGGVLAAILLSASDGGTKIKQLPESNVGRAIEVLEMP